MKICVVHPHRVTREVLSQTLTKRLDATVVSFSSIEELLSSSMDYDVFVLYNLFGREKMDRWEGVKWIRYKKPQALIISMMHHRFFSQRYDAPGGDAVLLKTGEETRVLVKLVQQGNQAKSFILVSGLNDNQGS